MTVDTHLTTDEIRAIVRNEHDTLEAKLSTMIVETLERLDYAPKSQVIKLQSQVDNLHTAQNGLYTRVNTVETQTSVLMDKAIERFSIALASMEKRIEQMFDTHNKVIASYTAHIDTLSDDVNALEAKDDALQGRIEKNTLAIEQNTNAVKSDVAWTKGEIGALTRLLMGDNDHPDAPMSVLAQLNGLSSAVAVVHTKQDEFSRLLQGLAASFASAQLAEKQRRERWQRWGRALFELLRSPKVLATAGGGGVLGAAGKLIMDYLL